MTISLKAGIAVLLHDKTIPYGLFVLSAAILLHFATGHFGDPVLGILGVGSFFAAAFML